MYELWQHTPTRTYVLAQSTSGPKLCPLADTLQAQFLVRKGNRLYTADYPRFTVRDNTGMCVYSAWYHESQRYKTVKDTRK